MELPAEHSLRNIILLMMKIMGERCSEGMNFLYFSDSALLFPSISLECYVLSEIFQDITDSSHFLLGVYKCA